MVVALKPSIIRWSVQSFIANLVIFLVMTPYGNKLEGGTTGIGIIHDALILSPLVFLILAKKFKMNFSISIIQNITIYLTLIFLWVVFFEIDSFSSIRSLLASVVFSFLFIICFSRNLDAKRSVTFLIKLNLIFIYIQFIVLFIFGKHIDLHQIIYPWSRETYYPTFAGLTRLTGIHMEPGVYATIITGLNLILLQYIYKPRLIFLTVLSLLLTVSISGIVYSVILAVVVVIRSNSIPKYIFTSIIMSFMLIIIYFSPIGDYIQTRLGKAESSSDSSINYKKVNLEYILERDYIDTLVGSGYRVNNCEKCEYINSNGFLFGLIFYHGIIGAALIIFMYFYIFKVPFNKFGIVFVLFLSIQRYDLGYYFIWGLGVINYILAKNEK